MGRKRGRKWFSRIVGVIASLTALCITNSNVDATAERPKSCPTPKRQQESVREKVLMVVSTLDGRVSALDVGEKGRLVWSIQADSRPLLSSSISKMEVTRDGVRTRLIPSLDGGLYQYDGDSIEAVPMSAETLLSSSFRLADDTMMIGGKDIRTYGIDPTSGQIRYLCTMAGCQDVGEGNYRAEEDLVVITRNTQTVRAVDARMGQEKWNFSVGRHEIEIIGGMTPPRSPEIEDEDDDGVTIASCNNGEEDLVREQIESLNDFDGFLKIVVPEGVIVALSPEDSSSVLWQHKFSSPVANAWMMRKGRLKQMSLFDTRNVPAISSFLPEDMDGQKQDPLLYVGMHQNQLYVQPSERMQETVAAAATVGANDVQAAAPRVTWRPYLSTAPSRTPILNNEGMPSVPQITERGEVSSETSLSVWHENYPFDNGYYLFPDFSPVALEGANKSPDNSSSGVLNIPATLWTWWKEVVAISLFTSVIVHLLLSRYMQRDGSVTIRQISSDSTGSSRRSDSVEDIQEPAKEAPYESRFLQDFEYLHCLGKGGFGIVFEAKNKVDDCNYAVKRISIPNREGHQERVIREVKALANLDHIGIVRFFRAWLETPPPGWQEEQDKQFSDSECLTPTPCNSVASLTSKSHLPPNQAMEPSLSGLQPLSAKLGILAEDPKLSLSYVNHLREGTSQEFSAHSMEESMDESGSFSCVDEQDKHFAENEESFSILFANSQSGLNKSNNCDVPFESYLQSGVIPDVQSNESFSVVFEDSGCKEKSSNGDASQENNSGDIDSSVFSENLHDKRKSNFEQPVNSDQKSPMPKIMDSACKTYLYIQMQLCQRETLKDWLNANTLNRDRTMVLDLFDQMVSAVDYVHKCGLMHRDLKPSNIFFSIDGSIKVGDFGLVTQHIEPQVITGPSGDYFSKHTAEVGTQLYMSPEQISRLQYDHKVDIFSLGMILFELLYPFSTQMERIKTLVDIKKQRFPERFTREMPNEHKVVSWLLSPKPSERPSAQEILDCHLLQDFAPRRMSSKLRSRTVSGSSNNSTGTAS